MAKSNKSEVESFVVFTDGAVDVEGSVRTFREKLETHITESSETDTSKIAGLVAAAMKADRRVRSDRLKADVINSLMGEDEDHYPVYAKAFTEYMKANSSMNLGDAVLYHTQKGPSGGVCTQELAAQLAAAKK